MRPKTSELNRELADLTRAIRANPGDPVVHENRGIAWFRRGDLDYAVEDFDEAVRLDPVNAHRYVMRALVWLERRDFTRAIADCIKAIRLDPQNGFAYSLYEHACAKRDRSRAVGAARYDSAWPKTRFTTSRSASAAR